jgi:2,5-diamino-6-(ribosylamino)-4(3H)-pyrimidinone 5'-phosphate reductase
LVSKSTPQSYLEYLRERNYDYIITGGDHVDYAKVLEILYEKYNCRIIRTDSGGILTNVLLEQGLIDEISLVISPCLVGTGEPHAFRSLSLENSIALEMISFELLDDDHLSIIYKVRARS